MLSAEDACPMSFAPSAAATGAATASRLCLRRHAVRRPGLQGDPRVGVRPLRCCATSAAAVCAYERPTARNAIVRCARGRCRAAGLVLGPRSRRRVAGHRRQDHQRSTRRARPYPRGPMRRPSPGVNRADLTTAPTSAPTIGVIPLLDQLGDLAGKTVTADAPDPDRIASYLRKHDAHYMFVAKGNQKTLLEDIQLWFHDDARLCPDDRQAHQRQAADRADAGNSARSGPPPAHLVFPGVGQAFLIRRTRCQCARAGDHDPAPPPADTRSCGVADTNAVCAPSPPSADRTGADNLAGRQAAPHPTPLLDFISDSRAAHCGIGQRCRGRARPGSQLPSCRFTNPPLRRSRRWPATWARMSIRAGAPASSM